MLLTDIKDGKRQEVKTMCHLQDHIKAGLKGKENIYSVHVCTVYVNKT